MTHTRLYLSAAIIGVAILLSFFFSVPHTRDASINSLSSPGIEEALVVEVSHAYRSGTHVFSGSVMAPDVCTAVSASAALEGETIVLSIAMPEDTEVCLEVPTARTFQASAEGPESLPFVAKVNGVVASTTPA